MALRYVMRLDELPVAAKLDILEQVAKSTVDRMRTLGVPDGAMIRLAASKTDFRLLGEALDGASAVTRAGRWLPTGRAGEDYLRSLYPGSVHRPFRTVPGLRGTTGYRFVDAFDPLREIARESKVGRADLTAFVQRQIAKEVRLLEARTFKSVEWHFFPSDRSGSLGPTRRLLDELQRRGIPYVIHLP